MGPATAGVTLYGAPLWPAGHLPHLGGNRMSRRLSPTTDVVGRAARTKLPISPLVGEMSGRTEGGATEHDARPRFSPP
ncbi:MAG: hypothetical protein EOR57_02940 [Mesorhizobium sp.]|nr:MAG: hypothetical protein EOR57_02940 [Mesorhizobium sp.]